MNVNLESQFIPIRVYILIKVSHEIPTGKLCFVGRKTISVV
jgi:hypothetical protein